MIKTLYPLKFGIRNDICNLNFAIQRNAKYTS